MYSQVKLSNDIRLIVITGSRFMYPIPINLYFEDNTESRFPWYRRQLIGVGRSKKGNRKVGDLLACIHMNN